MTSTTSDDDILSPLADAVDEPDTLRRLQDQLAGQADRDSLLDIAYTTFDSPVGSLLLAATTKGLVRVAYETEDHDRVLQSLAEQISPRILNAPARLADTVRELQEYFAGRRTEFDLPLDLSLSSGFRLAVQQLLPSITYGHTVSYSEMAQRVGNPRAVRAVGTACATNPLPVVVPCHRVLRADGQIGGYIGGPRAKSDLLALEAAA